VKPIVVQEQVTLPTRRCLSLTLAGISYRLFRSLITVAILTLAVAFLSHVLTFALLEQATKAAAYERLTEHRLLGLWLTRLREPDTAKILLMNLAAQEEARLREYAHWAGVDEAEAKRAAELASQFLRVQDYLESLPLAASAVLLGDLDARQALARLKEPAVFESFVQRMQQMDLPLPLEEAQLRELLVRQQPRLDSLLERIAAGQRTAIEKVRVGSGASTPGQLLAERSPQLGPMLRAAGFEVEDRTLEQLAERARQLED